jgi:autotransporter-associated beta strand protein
MLEGNVIALDHGISVNDMGTLVSSNTISLDIGLVGGGAHLFQVASGRTLSLTGGLFSSIAESVQKDGDGTLMLSGANVYGPSPGQTGTILNAGTLIVGNDHALGTGDLQLNRGMIQSGSGQFITLANHFTVAGPVTASDQGGGELDFTGTGHISVDQTGQPQTLTVANGFSFVGGVYFTGILFGTRSLTKTGSGRLTLLGTNTYEGGTQLQGGVVDVGNDSALGTGTLTLSGGTIEVNESVTLVNPFQVTADTRVLNQLLIPGVSTLTFAGAGTLSAGSTLTVTSFALAIHTATPIIFSGSLSGDGALTVDSSDVTLSGMAANTYTGTTTVNSGTLFLNKPAGVTAVAGPVVIGDGSDHGVDDAVLKLGADNQLDSMVDLTINDFGTLKEGNFNLGTGSIGGSNATNIITGDPPTLTVGFNNRSTTFAGVINGPGTVVKVGTGTWTLTGANTYAGGTIINAGTLMVNGAIGAVTVNPGGTLGGTGTTGPVTLSPGVNVSPGGTTPGILRVQSITFAAGSSFGVRINGPVAGTGYDQLQVAGTVNLGGATLNATLNPAFLPALGTAFTIITSTDILSGTFAGHPDGDNFLIGGTIFQIHYVNATGNHAVVLTAIAYTTGINIGALTARPLWLDSASTVISPSSSQRLTLTPGSHTLVEPGGGSITFQVAANGTVSYDPSLDQSGILSGQGTDTLTVNGALVTINAQALSNPVLVLDSYTLEQPGTFQARLLPGGHQLSESTDGSIAFTVNNDGTMSYDPALDQAGIVSGQNTKTLTVNGKAISGQGLTSTVLYLDNYIHEPAGAFQAHVLPGNHVLRELGGGSVTFVLNTDGTFSYDPSFEGVMTGQGTSTFVIHGAAVSINDQALTEAVLVLDSYAVQSPGIYQLVLLPGEHQLQASGGSIMTFTINPNATISIDDANLVASGIASVQNGNQLTVTGARVAIDARLLSFSQIFLDYYTIEQTSSVIFVNLLPGEHLLQASGGSMMTFTINPNATISIDDANLVASGIASVQNGNQLTVTGARVAIDARLLSSSQLSLDYYTVEPTSSVIFVNLLPGAHLLQAAGTWEVDFTITDQGLFDYAAALGSELSGQGTGTLTIYF